MTWQRRSWTLVFVALLLLGLLCQTTYSWSLRGDKLLPRALSFFRFVVKQKRKNDTKLLPTLIRWEDLQQGIHLGGRNTNQKPQETWDDYFQQLALQDAQSASSRGEVPVGAVVVQSLLHDDNVKENQHPPYSTAFRLLARAGNQVEQWHDASAHAEMIAMRQAASRLENWRLMNCTLYTTLEPCHMCLAAAHAFRIQRIVYGAPDLRLGGIERRGDVVHHQHEHHSSKSSSNTSSTTPSTEFQQRQPQHPFHTITNITAGVYANESAQLLQDFFRAKRKQAAARAKIAKTTT